MFEEIRLRRLGVIGEASLTLGPGFTAVTGETGAGKTMVVTALALLQGGRAGTGLVRDGTGQARVEGTVVLARLPEVAALVDDAGGEVDDDSAILARTLTADGQGRSRAFVGGASVPASVLAALGERLVTVHGQSEQHRLRQPAAQREALDRFAGRPVASLLADYRPAHRRLAAARAELAGLVAREQERAREIDLLRHGLDEMATVDPQPGEDDALRAEEDRLAHAGSLRAAAEQAHAVLAGGPGGGADQVFDAPDVGALTATARSALEAWRGHDPELAGLADRAAALSYAAADLALDLAAYAQDVDVDPARLAAVQDRRATLAGLTRRYGPAVDDVLAWGQQAAGRLAALQRADDAIGELQDEVAGLAERLAGLAPRLTAARAEAAATLSARVTSELVELAMPHARLVVDVRDSGGLGPDGADEVEFQLAANAGSATRRLAQGASGGELSRVMLALEVVLADSAPVPTFVFDEIDAGIGGRAAVEVGRRLARLACHAQVLVVTHLPQVAAFADRHYVVAKSDDGTVTTSDVRALDDTGRVRELSRMLAGLEDSAAAAAHAEELLELAARDRTRS
jgi:DNA repair protein RecN (Recombination protein N)